MRKLLGIATVVCAFIVPAFSQATRDAVQVQQPRDQDVIENLCSPDFNTGVNWSGQSDPFPRGYQELERVRIELLERGFNPGFDQGNGGNDEQLTDAVSQFQLEYQLPVTGQIDINTLTALSVPLQKLSPTDSVQAMRRAKPTQSK